MVYWMRETKPHNVRCGECYIWKKRTEYFPLKGHHVAREAVLLDLAPEAEG